MTRHAVPADHVFRNHSAAMRHLKQYKRFLKQRAKKLEVDILALPSAEREPVAYIVDALARNCGHFWAKHLDLGKNNIGRGMVIHHFDIDEDLMDAYVDRFGEAAVEDAGRWLLKRLHGESSIFVSWALGPIRFREESHLTVLENRILFNLVDRTFVSVLSHEKYDHPACVRYKARR